MNAYHTLLVFLPGVFPAINQDLRVHCSWFSLLIKTKNNRNFESVTSTLYQD